ncbi:D-ribitol-5-phosphate cytidylyltransferase isoform X2 [Aquarana catesbeiana]|uniref:D-ribitol-5-phosphate cytidylyltransferase isoform X2 n=1 Tax=Aquarana catesbeiana TaxID=8400 RepID=UPI003CC941AD
MAEMRRVSVVLPAGGTGERLGGGTPKQYCPVLGRALISRTMEAMERVSWISDIVVVVAVESVDLMKSIIHTYGHKRITLVEGGVTRHRSIFNGLRAFLEDHSLGPALQKPEVVIIHDAVRPFVEEDVLLQVARSAKEHGCTDYDLDFGTECLHLALEYSKVRAKLVEGPPDLWKVTYKRDLYAAESIIKECLGKQLCIITHNKEDAIQIGFLLHETLKSQIKNLKAISSSMCKTIQDLQSILQGLCYNFVCINVKESDFEETQKITGLLQTPGVCPSYPSVVVSVHLDFLEQSGSQNLSGIRDLAKEAQKADVLVYGLLIRFSKDDVRLQENVQEASAIIVALLKDRNPVFTGQILVAGK